MVLIKYYEINGQCCQNQCHKHFYYKTCLIFIFIVSIVNSRKNDKRVFDNDFVFQETQSPDSNSYNRLEYDDNFLEDDTFYSIKPTSNKNLIRAKQFSLNKPREERVLNTIYNNYSEEKTSCDQNICTNGIFKWHKSKTKNIYVGGIFPMIGGWPGGQSCLPSAIMALNEVNLNASILPDYKINLNWFNSECNPGKGISNLYEMIFHKKRKQDDVIMVLGPGCSDVSSSVAEVANYWNLTVLSFGSSSPALSNRKRFKTFFRTHPTAVLDNPARLSLCKKYKWKKIATLQNDKELFTSTIDNLEKEAKKFDIEILVRQTFTDDPIDAVKNLKKQDARIIVGVFYEDDARKVFCQAYKEGMIFPKYIWMIIGWYSENWYLEGDENEVKCNKTEMKMAVYGHLTTEVQMFTNDIYEKLDYGTSVIDYDENFRRFVSSEIWKSFARSFPKLDHKYKQSMQFSENYKTLLDLYERINSEYSIEIEKLGGYLERSLAYDAVWVMAYSLNKTLNHFGSLVNFNIRNYEISEYIKETMKQTNFKGISGLVTFDDQGDRLSEVKYEQLQMTPEGLKYVRLGTHFKDMFDCCKNITWGSRSSPPVDGVQHIKIIKKINSLNSIVFFIVSAINFLLGLICLIFNKKFKNKRIIMYSQPDINNVMIIGIFLCLSSVFLFGYDKSNLSVNLFNILCKIEVSILMIGFNIGYGSLFTKIWFVYTAQIEKKKNHLTEMQTQKKLKLYTLLIILTFIDLILLIVWSLKDPLQKMTIKLASEYDVKMEIIYDPEIEICKCKHEMIWIGISFSIKAIILILGLYLSYETRNAKIERINDARFVSVSIYNIVVLAMVAAPVTIIIQNQLDASFFFLAFTINICSLLTLALIFIPKVKHMIRNPYEEELNEICLNETKDQESKDKYFKTLKENDELNDIISKREQFLKAIEAILNGTDREDSTSLTNRNKILVNNTNSNRMINFGILAVKNQTNETIF